MKMAIKHQNTGSDHALIFRPSNGPNGSMLNPPNIAFAASHIQRSSTSSDGLEPNITTSGNTSTHRSKFVAGPAREMIPFCLRSTFPATITAPGAMNRNPNNAAIISPVRRPRGSARNSAQQPNRRADHLCANSCKMKAGPKAIDAIMKNMIVPIIIDESELPSILNNPP